VAAEKVCLRQEFVTALSRTTVIARGPKPVAALRELGVVIAAVVPELNTWRELLRLLDERSDSIWAQRAHDGGAGVRRTQS
jgi:hypothetical protein